MTQANESIFKLEDLDVIGFTEVPDLSVPMPRRLSAIFGVRGTTTVLMPPYTLNPKEVVGPVRCDNTEFRNTIGWVDRVRDLLATEGVSSLFSIPAKADHELWLDDKGNVHYETSQEVQDKLIALSKKHVVTARGALMANAWQEARKHAMVAYSANSGNLQPLVLRAAAEYQMAKTHPEPKKIQDELALTELLAEAHIPVSEFRELYLELTR